MAEPLGQQDLERINDNLNQLKVADEQAKLATQAGLDVSALKTRIIEQRGQLNKLKQTYFPGQ